MSADILSLTVAELTARYRQGKLSPVEAARAALEQCHRHSGFNAFILLAEEKDLLGEAASSERRWRAGEPSGPLDGVPVTIKDEFDVRSWPTRDGSLVSSDAPAEGDSPPVARLREAGAIFLGKTNLPEYGHKGVTDSRLAGVTLNPWDKSKTPGGSSGGAAVAAALRMGWLHLGSDGGGSIRIPASFCGVVGHKPTQGLIPRHPPSLFSTLATAGPLARCVEDAALMLSVIARPDPRDGSALPMPREDYAAMLRENSQSLRIAYAPTINDTAVAPDTARLVREAALKLGTIGMLEEVRLDVPLLVDTFNKHWMAAAAWLVKQIGGGQRDKLDPNLLDWAAEGESLALETYLDAELERLRIIDRMSLFFMEHDILVMPTMALSAFSAGQNDAPGADGRPWRDWTPFTYLANLSRLPAASVPCGLDGNGLPVGIQVLGGSGRDSLVLRVASILEHSLGLAGFYGRLNEASGDRQ